ncbi:MAG TPA: hypothetical protein DIT25_02235 [Candidatus Moranbacteria bacterium]|nr:hypothetical protein [Candidatus Moranbacteria bacterium]
MIISFNGQEGSGKSTISKKIAEKLGIPWYYMGGIMRQKAGEKGLTLAEYGKLRDENPIYDKEIDDYLVELGKKEDAFVIDSRTAWHFIPGSINIYLKVDINEAAGRILKALSEDPTRKNEDKKIETPEDMANSIQNRRLADNERYMKYYGINPNDESNYDFILDTTNLSIEEVLAKVMEFIHQNR